MTACCDGAKTSLLLAVLFLSFTGFTPRASAQDSDDSDDLLDVFLPATRELRYQLSSAERSIDEQRFSDAVRSLSAVFAAPEDFFIDPSETIGPNRSVKRRAHELLGNMPPKGRALYELQFGSDSLDLLQSGVRDEQIQKLAEASRTFFHTDAGYEATILLGRYHLDHGRPLAAAMCFKRIIETPGIANRYEPDTSLLLAASWLYAGMPENAEQVLVSLKDRMPRATVSIGGKDVRLFEQSSDALSWVESLLGPVRAPRQAEATEWTMFRGAADRNARSNGDMPLANAVWRLPVANDPSDEQLVKQLQKQYLDQRFPALPSMQVLAVDNWLLMRTPSRLFGVDFETGKRVWEYPWGQYTHESDDADAQNNGFAPRLNQLNQRLWEDSPYGQMSSDGKTVYLLHELGFAMPERYAGQMLIGVNNGRARSNPDYPRDYNSLVAISLRDDEGKPVEGKVRWMVGGADGNEEPKLAGAFFLGPPLPLLGQLYAMIEVDAEIRLVVLDGKSGRLQWSQQLALLESRPILQDTRRRLAGATPSFADGILVCPTSAGAAVGVDLSTRTLAWGYRYKHVNVTSKYSGFPSATNPDDRAAGQRWADATATIADGCVLLTPVESEEMHCIDLLTGESKWPAGMSRGDLLYVAGVHGGNAIFVGKNQVAAYQLADGKQAWTTSLGKTALPSGRGFLTGQYYYLPTSDAETLQIDLVDGQIVRRSQSHSVLGNLICYKGHVVSQGVDFLSVFHQEGPLREQVEKALLANPDDAVALANRGELEMHDGDQRAALETIRRAYAMNSEDDATRALLVKSLLTALHDDFAKHQEVSAEVERLIDHPDQRSEFLRLQAVGLQEIGKIDEAFAAFLALVDRRATLPVDDAAESAIEQVQRNLSIRRDRWIHARIAQLLSAANPAARQTMDALIRDRFEQAVAAGTVQEMSAFIDHFGAHPLADQVRLKLAAEWIQSREMLAAELILMPLSESSNSELAGPATAHLARLLEQSGRSREAARTYELLAARFGDVVCLDDKTGRELSESLPTESAVQQYLGDSPAWATGLPEIEGSGETVGRTASSQRNYPVRCVQSRGAASEHIYVSVDHRSPNSIVVSDGFGDELTRVSLARADSQRFYTSNYEPTYCRVYGHLLVVSIGYEIIAIDLLHAASNPREAIRWRDELPGPLTTQYSPRYIPPRHVQSKSVSSPLGFSLAIALDEQGRRVGATASLNHDGFCYLKQGELLCVSPLDGQTLWSRTGFDPGSDLFGDDEFVFVVTPDGRQARVFKTVDGSEAGQRDLRAHAKMWTTVGRQILSWSQQQDTLRLSLFDAWTEKDVWSQDFPAGTKACLAAEDELAVVQPNGELFLVSLADGEQRFSARVEEEPALESIHVQRSNEQYLLFADSTPDKVDPRLNIQSAPTGFHSPLVNGHVYAFDRTTGEPQWQTPAFIDQYGFPLDQPPELPVLAFMRHMTPTTERGPRVQTSLLCIDKRDGRVLIEQDDIPAPTFSYRIVGDVEKQSVSVELPGKSFAIQFTDRPLPPAPPAQTGAASSLSVNEAASVRRDSLMNGLAGRSQGGFDPDAQQQLQDEALRKNLERAAEQLVPKLSPTK